MTWMIWTLFVGLLWIFPAKARWCTHSITTEKIQRCLESERNFIVPDKFYGVIKTKHLWNNTGDHCVIFLLAKNTTAPPPSRTQTQISELWPRWERKDDWNLLLIIKWHIQNEVDLYVLEGRQCNNTVLDAIACEGNCSSPNHTGICKAVYVHTKYVCKNSVYDESYCNNETDKSSYVINITTQVKGCINCNKPVKKPEKKYGSEALSELNVTLEIKEGEDIDPAQAAEVMTKMSNLAASINESSAALTMGEGVSGILVRETEPALLDEVNFAYTSPNDEMSIIDSQKVGTQYPRSISLPKEAFEKALSLNISVPFAAVLRFTNLAKDELNSSVLNDEVLGIEMGAMISNLTSNISISFRNVKYEGYPSCQSWNGEGSRPNWTDDGCETIPDGENITCRCSHLTFFAILMSPPNQTISTSDLNTLTTITQVGCGLSMFFLGIVLFMHLLLRKAKASKATRILIHLVTAMFLLNLTFLINNYVAKMGNSVGCKIMAAVMHYFMLTTFTWFAVNAFHLCLQLHMGGKIVIRRYILKVSLTSWGLPSIFAVALLIAGKYGEQFIHTNDSDESVSMCWITDSDVHYIVNIGYYVLVFLFTFTTFIIMLSWLFCLKRINANDAQTNKNGKSIMIIMGLCCILGITWGFAFFAHGVLRIPSYYIFTVLNSFQGFFLFIYYYNTSHSGEISGGNNGPGKSSTSSSSSISTLKTSLDKTENPYSNLPDKK